MCAMALQEVQHALIEIIPDMRRFARSLTGSSDAANELVQAACERALGRQGALNAIEQPVNWMCSIIKNLWIDEKRSARERLLAPLEDVDLVAPEDTERAVIARSTLAKVRVEIMALPEEQRSVIMLVCVQGHSYLEAASELGIPIGTLMSRLSRARLELARRMNLSSQRTEIPNAAKVSALTR
jgi:RNA polymerase sigma-70 factor (ECF subfamily)